MKAIQYNQRTVSAIRKADAMPQELYGGTFRKGAYPGGVGTSRYSGMFAVTKKDDSTVTIAAGTIILGLTTLPFNEDDLTISADGYVYFDIVWGGTAYTTTAANGIALPAQTNTHYYVPLAEVSYVDLKVTSIIQIQYGAIQGAGRVF